MHDAIENERPVDGHWLPPSSLAAPTSVEANRLAAQE
jgi:hypothetical protein